MIKYKVYMKKSRGLLFGPFLNNKVMFLMAFVKLAKNFIKCF